MAVFELIFDPYNPTDFTKFSNIPKPDDPLFNRFQQMRETAGTERQNTIGFGERWEERICQLNYNAEQLFSKLNPDILISKNCIRSNELEWIADTPQTGDLIISKYDKNHSVDTPQDSAKRTPPRG